MLCQLTVDKASFSRIYFCSSKIQLLVVACLLIVSPVSSENRASEEIACKRQLNQIFEAIDAYHNDNGDYPSSLEELSPSFLGSLSNLICPTAKGNGDTDHGLDSFVDASSSASTYAYELSGIPFASHEDRAFTLREFKLLQQKAIGDSVPLIRCFRHNRVINLPFHGKCYPSGPYWEHDFTSERGLPYMGIPLFLRYPFPLETYIPAPNQGSPDSIDLGSAFNALLNDPWLGDVPTCPLQGWSPGQLKRHGTTFDIRAIVQLQGHESDSPEYPRQVTIPVARHASTIEFLHGTAKPGSHSELIASYRIKFDDHSIWEIPIRYGIETHQTDASLPQSAQTNLVWPPSTAAARDEDVNATFHLRVVTPQPNTFIESIEIVSHNTNTWPFLLAISIKNEVTEQP